jgi:hypothetical protein
MKRNYACYWLSPRGFANEGTYLYGTIEDCRKAVEPYYDNTNSVYTLLSRHETIEAAQARAEKESRISRKRTAWGEQDYTGSESAIDYMRPVGLS